MTRSTPGVTAAFGIAILAACGSGDGGPEVVPYLGQPVPGTTPEQFAPGVVNTDEIEINGVFAPDGRMFLFARQIEGVFTIYQAEFHEDGWSEPRPLDIYGDGTRVLAVDMTLTTDGRVMYFLGQHEHEGEAGPPDLDIWASRREEDGWAPAELVPPPVSTDQAESYPVVVADGSLYFPAQRPEGLGGYDIYRSQRLPDGSFAEPENLGPPVNTEFHEGDTFVAPDESYLILSSQRPGGLGQNDLYVSFRGPDGRWSEPENMGPAINSEHTDFCPMVTPDGRYLFFSRRIGGSWAEASEGEIYWVDIGVIDEFRR